MSLRLALSPSPVLAALIVGLHGAAGGCLFMVKRDALGLALGAAVVALGLAAAWSRALLRARGSVRALEIGGESLILELADGRRIAVAAPARCFVTRLLVALPLRRALLVSADMLGVEEFRLLRLWALWARLPGVAGKQLPA